MAIDKPIEPTIVERGDQPYAGMRRTVTMSTFNEVNDRIPEIFTWLAGKGAVPAGPPFVRLTVIDMDADIEAEAGVPVIDDVWSEDPVFGGVLPAGRYVTYTHLGHPDGLVDATAAVLAWAEEAGHRFDVNATMDGVDSWECRLIIYLTDPTLEPDLDKWETELLFKLAD